MSKLAEEESLHEKNMAIRWRMSVAMTNTSVLYCAVLCHVVLWCDVVWCDVLCYAVQCCAVLALLWCGMVCCSDKDTSACA